MSHRIWDNKDIVKWADLSPAMQTLYATFLAHTRDIDNSVLFIYFDDWHSSIHFHAVRDGENPWEVYDRQRSEQPERFHTLLMALDLRKPFVQQMPTHFLKTLERFDCFANSPRICIRNRDGVVPAAQRDQALRRAIWPELKCVVFNPHVTPLSRRKRSRDHLRAV
jgi:hypothetical protein